MTIENLTEDQAKKILDILAKRMGLDYCTIKYNMFFMVYKGAPLVVALDSPYQAVEYKYLDNYRSYVKVLEAIMSRRREDNYTMICIPETISFHEIKRPHCLEELLIQRDIA